MSAQEYLPYLKSAYKIIKEIDPDAKVVGLCSTSDLSGQALDFIAQSIKLGALQYMDILSVHLYDAYKAPEKTRGLGTDVILKQLKEEMKKAGHVIPIWHTEKAKGPGPLLQGYSPKELPAPAGLLSDNRYYTGSLQEQCQDFVREYLLNYMAGATNGNGGKTFWHGSFTKRGIGYISKRSDFPFSYAIHEYDNSPRPALIAANAFAQAMKGCRPWKALDAGGDYRCHIHKGKDKVVVALWSWQKPQNIKLKVGSIPYRLTNVFGALIETPEEKGVIKIKLDKDPKYLHLETSDIKKAESIFLNVESPEFKPNIRLELINDNKSKTGLSFLVEVKNTTPIELSGSISFECPDGWSISSSNNSFIFKKLKSNKKISRIFPLVSIGNCDNGKATFTVITSNGYKSKFVVNIPLFNSQKALKESLKATDAMISKKSLVKKVIDGDFSDWDGDNTVYMTKSHFIKYNSNDKAWKDSLDLSCSLRSRYDDEFIYFAAYVVDDVIDSYKLAKEAYEKDAIEFFFDIDLSDKKDDYSDLRNNCNEDDHQVYFAPADGKILKKASAWYGKLKGDGGMKVVSRKLNLGYNLEIAIPLSMLKLKIQKDKKIGFSFTLNDSDNGKKKETVFVWHGNLINYRKPSQLGKMIFQ